MAVTKEDVLGYLEKASMLEVSELIKDIEDKFGVTAAARVAVAAAPAAGGAAGTFRAACSRRPDHPGSGPLLPGQKIFPLLYP